MRAFLAFLRKEIMEAARSYRLLIVLAVCALMGILSPLMASLLPELLGSMMTDGITITLAPPTVYDSWSQFFKNMSQMGLIVILIVESGLFSGEYAKDTLVGMLTKGLSRPAIVSAKWAVSLLTWTVGYWLCFGICYGYTAFLFPGAQVSNLLLSVACLWAFVLLLLTALTLGGTLVRNSYGALLLAAGAFVVLMLLNLVPALQSVNPYALAAQNMALLQGTTSAVSMVWPIVLCFAATACMYALSLLSFRRRPIL